ncbi:MAG: molybdenum cofactor guanylyltransferase [Actinomycetota bacterium]
MVYRPSAGRRDGDFAAAVLCGGKGRRLGMNKVALEVGGLSVLEHIIGVLKGIFPLIYLVTQKNDRTLGELGDEEVEVVNDLLPGRGPLGGIYTALEYASKPYVFVMACDMPYPEPRLIHLLLSRAPGWEAVVPRRGPYIEPLFAVYSRETRERIRRRLEGGRLKIHEIIDELLVCYVEEGEMVGLDPSFLSFFNINTPEDLEKARRLQITRTEKGH